MYCINMCTRPERWSSASKNLKSVGFTAERFRASAPDSVFWHEDISTIDKIFGGAASSSKFKGGALGIILSNLRILTGLDPDQDYVTVWEDDVHFFPDARQVYDDGLAHLPPDWGIVTFDSVPYENKGTVPGGLSKWSQTWNVTTGVMIHRRAVPYIFERCRQLDAQWDTILGELYPDVPSYNIKGVCYQDGFMTDIQNTVEERDTLRVLIENELMDRLHQLTTPTTAKQIFARVVDATRNIPTHTDPVEGPYANCIFEFLKAARRGSDEINKYAAIVFSRELYNGGVDE